jgi:hypothetical protein
MCATVIKLKSAASAQEKPAGEPISEYINQVADKTVSTVPYERLMIYYRKQKEYDKEVQVIKKGIASLKDFYSGLQKGALKRKINPKVKALSKKLGTSMGLIDKKGNDVYLPDPLPKWIKRQKVAEEKLKKQKERNKKKK